MAIIEFINGKKNDSGVRTTYKTLSSMKRLINYILRKDKTIDLLKGGIYCNPDTAYDEFIITKAAYGKLPETKISKSNQVVHFAQSFKKDELDEITAKRIADDLMKYDIFKGFQVVYAVHMDTDQFHTHFAINTVNYETGLRWHISKNDIQKIKDYSDELCRKYNLSVIPKKEKINRRDKENRLDRHISSGEYRARRDGRSWKSETLHAGLAARKIAESREEFIRIMESLGYKVRWEDNRKDITFINAAGKKINSDKLGFPERSFTPLTKEALEKQFALNRQVSENKNSTVLFERNQLKKQILKVASDISRNRCENQYPFQTNNRLKNFDLEGQALKDKLMEEKKGKGFDWEQES